MAVAVAVLEPIRARAFSSEEIQPGSSLSAVAAADADDASAPADDAIQQQPKTTRQMYHRQHRRPTDRGDDMMI